MRVLWKKKKKSEKSGEPHAISGTREMPKLVKKKKGKINKINFV